MGLVMTYEGAQFTCDACGELITEGKALFKPLSRPEDRAEVLSVRASSRGAPRSRTVARAGARRRADHRGARPTEL